jgi:hypothetical protein
MILRRPNETFDEERARVMHYLSATPEERESIRLLYRFDALSAAALAAKELGGELGGEIFEERRIAICALAQEYPEAHAQWLQLKAEQ